MSKHTPVFGVGVETPAVLGNVVTGFLQFESVLVKVHHLLDHEAADVNTNMVLRSILYWRNIYQQHDTYFVCGVRFSELATQLELNMNPEEMVWTILHANKYDFDPCSVDVIFPLTERENERIFPVWLFPVVLATCVRQWPWAQTCSSLVKNIGSSLKKYCDSMRGGVYLLWKTLFNSSLQDQLDQSYDYVVYARAFNGEERDRITRLEVTVHELVGVMKELREDLNWRKRKMSTKDEEVREVDEFDAIIDDARAKAVETAPERFKKKSRVKKVQLK